MRPKMTKWDDSLNVVQKIYVERPHSTFYTNSEADEKTSTANEWINQIAPTFVFGDF